MKTNNYNNKKEESVVYKRRYIEEIMELIDRDFALILLAVFIPGFYAINMFVEVPPIEVDIMDNSYTGRFDSFIHEPVVEDPKVEEIEPVKKILLKTELDGVADAASSRKASGDEGRVGDRKSSIANTSGSSRRSVDEKVANSSGIMGALTTGSAAADRVFGGGGLGAGLEKNLGLVAGIGGVDQYGSGGLSVRGFGTGGGGNALTIGGFNTRGKGGNPNSKYGMASGGGFKKAPSSLSAGGGAAVIMGAIDRSVVDAYIKRNLAKIRWCYEKELAKSPNLFGRISITFIIGGNGSVSTSKVSRTTMKSEPVESCVASVIKQIRFPKPKGGGIVTVNYPFVFKNSEV
ncbi:MAG TPA: AgmX/PglI C-terminal domain-containing protein [bacterium]|nr:AgmX/PglI C-terminal domain-containing protein [bacterium]HQO91040.1 AgmX/PglI C-terminal domain-containing protein [bacterium]